MGHCPAGFPMRRRWHGPPGHYIIQYSMSTAISKPSTPGFVGFGLTALVERCRKGKVGIRQRYPILIGPCEVATLRAKLEFRRVQIWPTRRSLESQPGVRLLSYRQRWFHAIASEEVAPTSI